MPCVERASPSVRLRKKRTTAYTRRARIFRPQHHDLHDRHGFPPVDIQPPLRVSVPPRPTHGRWAACAGRSPDSRLRRLLRPSRRSRRDRQWFIRSRLAAYSCGGSPGFGARRAAPCSLFITLGENRKRNRHVWHSKSKDHAVSTRGVTCTTLLPVGEMRNCHYGSFRGMTPTLLPDRRADRRCRAAGSDAGRRKFSDRSPEPVPADLSMPHWIGAEPANEQDHLASREVDGRCVLS